MGWGVVAQRAPQMPEGIIARVSKQPQDVTRFGIKYANETRRAAALGCSHARSVDGCTVGGDVSPRPRSVECKGEEVHRVVRCGVHGAERRADLRSTRAPES
jgi:hypothetical protein